MKPLKIMGIHPSLDFGHDSEPIPIKFECQVYVLEQISLILLADT